MNLIIKVLMLMGGLAILGTPLSSEAKSSWSNRLPFGMELSCAACHSGIPSPRNSFGNDYNGNWNSTLAAQDSDGDGFTNGEELGDPSGTWNQGDPNPAGGFSNPGDANSKPLVVAPAITQHPAGQSVTVGADVTFGVSASGTQPLSYQWQKEGSDLPGETAADLVLNNVGPGDAGSYAVRVSNAGGSITSDPAVLGVLPITAGEFEIQVTHPGEGDHFLAPAHITLVAKIKGSLDSMVQVEFFAGEIRLGNGTILSSDDDEHDDGDDEERDEDEGEEEEYDDDEGEERDEDDHQATGESEFSLIWADVPAGEYFLTARGTDTQGAIRDSESVHITVTDTGETLPLGESIVTMVAHDSVASMEGDISDPDTATFVVRRRERADTELVVYYSVEGSAVPGIDYEELSGFVTIQAGRRSARIPLVPVSLESPPTDSKKTVKLGLIPSPTRGQNSSGDYIIGKPSRAAVIIVGKKGSWHKPQWVKDGSFHYVNPRSVQLGYRVEVSRNLIDWETAATNRVPIDDDEIHYVDPDDSGLSMRFFRVVPDPNAPPDED